MLLRLMHPDGRGSRMCCLKGMMCQGRRRRVVGRWQPWMMVSFKPAGDGFEDEGLFCHDQAEGTYLIQ